MSTGKVTPDAKAVGQNTVKRSVYVQSILSVASRALLGVLHSGLRTQQRESLQPQQFKSCREIVDKAMSREDRVKGCRQIEAQKANKSRPTSNAERYYKMYMNQSSRKQRLDTLYPQCFGSTTALKPNTPPVVCLRLRRAQRGDSEGGGSFTWPVGFGKRLSGWRKQLVDEGGSKALPRGGRDLTDRATGSCWL